ncbi:hypothetical protein BO70DRAFT_357270 [Aspergillus heteromorphus CBS 117.55]|uniref:Uncharacterized protein n=1 Tax=Aspergillus heteromorphus CBS 117.55 TaxID=1448321 RepID=A0A317X0G1_9EURO|nr:uncharacterized protein BO70DRAFT_357270 [Aspergillus heteromorphus CBS 117.55]PWY92126.1 hypothetical protein BO70DRAFT_357270 [Aspergillus heteromorphus CBS 117.55]
MALHVRSPVSSFCTQIIGVGSVCRKSSVIELRREPVLDVNCGSPGSCSMDMLGAAGGCRGLTGWNYRFA